jgi:hypothetical protein
MSPSRIRRNQRRERRAAVRAILYATIGADLVKAWRHARWVWTLICFKFHRPEALAQQEYLLASRCREIESWIRPLELLARRIILAAALTLDVVLKPLSVRSRATRKRSRIVLSLARPHDWIARFPMLPRRPREGRSPRRHGDQPKRRFRKTFPLARRLEAVRRVLADPDTRVRRFATQLARIAARNATAKANAPRLFQLRPWSPANIRTWGEDTIRTGMEIVMPLAEERLARWNQQCEPG